ncbi:cilia- and flagella-associated protein 47-like isoform X2 [Mizuhopecten yessoensis]|uniref:cilia- and flagella-associated protein 47-like isoform X2 n=1 Tax=Mizuhopecten yessoensis TaxID=6573 RepID=UPI000B45C20E|nr:cilia- and flagella-associated protein 47-like isoform X2 [Mizuhopecten yessoensis]
MEGDKCGVRITPSVLEFYDAEVNTVHQLNVTVKNTSKTSKSIRYYGPKSKYFQLKVRNPNKPVAPGLCVPAVIEFEIKEEKEVTDRLVVTVDGDVIEIPLVAYPPQPLLEIEQVVNFGNLVANSKTVSHEISLVNHGSKAGDFKIKYNGDKPIAIMPSSGSVPPKSVQMIKVEYVTKQAGTFEEVAKVKLEGKETKNLVITGQLVDRTLEVLAVNTRQPIECVRFGSTYYGSDKTECALLFNNGPEPINFVAVLDEDAVAQEMGVDLTKSTVDALADQGSDSAEKPQGRTNVLTSLITAIPNQGTLQPYEKIPVFFRFSPRWNASKEGWKGQKKPPPRKDFALFMRIQIVGSSTGFSAKSPTKYADGSFVEVALTGTALPVLLSVMPSLKYDFGECPIGEHADVLCTIKNESTDLATTFQFRRVAHFSTHPPSGKIPPNQSQDVIFSFSPKQIGGFKTTQMLDVIGQVADNQNPTVVNLQVISSFPLTFLGSSDPIFKKKQPKYNPGITPYISNEVGMFVDTTFSQLDENPRNAVAGGLKPGLHSLKNIDPLDKDARVSFPNDRATSIRPSERGETYKTIFTKTKRHNYVDPDYALNLSEEANKVNHRNSYVGMLRQMRQNRLNQIKSREFKDTNNKLDIGIKTAAGLRPKRLTQMEIIPDPRSPTPPNADFKLLSTKELSTAEAETLTKEACEGLNAVPTTKKEKLDCSKCLSPQQLHQIIIGPPTLDFGQVCLRSVCTKNLAIINNLDTNIHIVAEIDCRELRQSSPLSQVVPPKSKAHLPIVYESNTKGKFQRSVSYTVNGHYKHHVTVVAEVVPVALDLSTEELILTPAFGLPAEAEFRGVITLYNNLNYPAEFTWAPNLGDRGTAFSIRPATGIVDAHKDLDCEVVWHPSFLAPEDGSFSLMVHGGPTLQLQCKVEMGTPNVQFMERRVMFGQTPINLTTVRSALLANTGQHHAYFQVIDSNPFPGLMVTPLHGVVPVGGHAELKVQLTPSAILKFDTKVQVAIKGGKVLELRMGGTVEPPTVDIDMDSFNFGGVYCGSGATLPFKLANKAITKVKLELDLTRYKDFSLNFSGYQTQDDYSYQMLNPGMFTVTMAPEETIEGEIIFTPSEVAAYDFIMPVIINQIGAPSPAPTPFPPTPAPSNKNSIQHIINPRPQPLSIATPRKHVIATALRQPLQLSSNKIEFALPSTFEDPTASTGLGVSKHTVQQGTVLVNNSDKPLKWLLDLSAPVKALQDGIIKFIHPSGVPFVVMDPQESKGVEGILEPGQTQHIAILFCPTEPCRHELVIPILINDSEKPYQYLQVIAEMKSPKLWFDPLAIVMTPVPLMTEVSTEFTVLAGQYSKPSQISVITPTVECEDGSTISPISVVWPEGSEVSPCCGDDGQIEPCALPCKLIFSSPKPVSFAEPILFVDSDDRKFKLMVMATSDNCLLTCYHFLALHRTDHQIVCEQGASPKGRKFLTKESLSGGEAVIVPCVSPTHNSRPSTSATSSNFQISSSSYESSGSVTDSTDGSTPVNREGAMNKPPSGSEHAMSRNQQDLASRSLGSAMFPDEDSEEGIFHLEVLLAVQRWYSSQGWPSGQFPISIPHSLRSGISRKPINDDMPKQAKAGSWDTNNLKKEFKTIYDMMCHLAGRPIPGIPINSPLPSDPIERVKQVYWQHSTLLTFLKCQGACVASIKPEYLMEPRDYHLWKQMQKQLKLELMTQGEEEEAKRMDEEEELEGDVFEAVSKRAWTDILLQILKCVVLSKVTPRSLKNLVSPDKNVEMPIVNPDPLSSNIYCVGERIILTWLNHHYEHYRTRIWSNCSKGGVPPSRWIVNYDFDLLDGLVLAAVLGAHMPFLIKTHLQDMYTHPATAEQCLHNALKVVNAMRYAGIDYDIQAIDITDPNPIALLLLCVNLYQRLPQYIPKATIDFSGSLHASVTRQVKLSNPSGKTLVYQVLIAGHDARDFGVPKGEFVSISPRSILYLNVDFTSRFLRPAEATLILVGRRHGSSVGTTLTFNLRTQIDNITPKKKTEEYTIKCEAPCYELEKIPINVRNPFNEAGDFRIVLVEAQSSLLEPGKTASLLKPKDKRKRKVRARIDHGQKRPETPPTPPPKLPEETDKSNDDQVSMSAFYSPNSSVYLDAKGSSTVEIYFLPFNIGERQVSVIFLNESIGEFLYSVEATATLPLPAVVPFVKTPHSVRISSAAAAGTGRGLFGGDDRVVYWKCESGQTLQENLKVPVLNKTKEKALLMAAQQHMSSMELQRRQITGTLKTSSVTAKTISLLTNNVAQSISRTAKSVSSETGVLETNNSENMPSKSPYEAEFTVEVDSEFFSVPNKLTMKPPSSSRSHSAPVSDYQGREPFMELPIKFKAKEPGHYPCEIILRGSDDVRVYKIECTVNPEGSTAELQFKTPVHQSVSQEIPVVNMTNHDWPLKATIEGSGFYGPPTVLVKAYNPTTYPLVFKPQNEVEVKGKLVLTNTEDGTEHIYHLHGRPEKPLALDHVVIKCDAKKSTAHILKIPNVTKRKMCYRVESDLPFLSGNTSLTVLQGKTGVYNMSLTPSRRGIYKGIVAFIAGKNPVIEVDSDGDEIPEDEDEESRKYYGYRIWYSLEVHVKPPPPERIMSVVCACQKKAVIEVIVRNPTPNYITIQAQIEGRNLSGPSSISLDAGEKDVYSVTYAPAIIGKQRGSLIFYQESVGEFWYDLRLQAEPPPQTTLLHMECDLGRWTKQTILLENPTDESLELIPTMSNTNNFSLERDNERPIVLRPRSSIQVPIHFMPSTLGQGDHLTKVIFNSEQLGEWVFIASGTGLLPLPQDPVSVFTEAGSNTTLIIPFRNPMDHAVMVDILLRDTNAELDRLTYENSNPSNKTADDSAFCLLLKHRNMIRVGPKSTLDIPVCFAPTEMMKYDALCTVVVRKEDGGKWQYAPRDSEGYQLSTTGSDGLQEIRWVYPISGIPESKPAKDTQGAVIECKARDRVEERLEVTLAGVAPASSGPQRSILTRSVTPKDQKPKIADGVVIGETLATAEEFVHELGFTDNEAQENLQNSVAVTLVRQQRDTSSGLVILVYNIVYAPFKPMSHNVELVVKAATGGLWRFPLKFVAAEPPSDDTITIEATGLNQESSVGFRLTSQAKHPVIYNSYFAAGSDPEFLVSPQSGELLPQGTNGTLLKISFKPAVYGKLYQAKLIVQTPDMQWSYNVKGVLPQYNPPRGISTQPMAGPHPDPRLRMERVNYIRENIRLLTTAVSSPIKGANVVPRKLVHFS